MKKLLVYIAVGVIGAGVAGVASYLVFKPRPTRLSMTPRAGDDTVVVNQIKTTHLRPLVFDQYGRHLLVDSAVRYQWIAGDSVSVASNGEVKCAERRDAVVRATLATLAKDFTLRCRPVVSIETPSWFDLIVGDSARDLSFVAHAPDGSAVTELRGAVSVGNGAIVEIKGTTIRAKAPGRTFADVRVGDAGVGVPIAVYEPVTSFVAGNPKRGAMMAMRVNLARGDTIITPLPEAAFWVTYYSRNRDGVPPTIEIVGSGSCTTGNGLNARRVEEGQYAKYCRTRKGDRMMIAHGTSGGQNVNGIVALRLDW